MAIGAILITTGCGTASGAVCGGITVAQRMIASLQKSGVAMIVVVTGPEDKKMEKQLAQFGESVSGEVTCAISARVPRIYLD